MRDGAKLSKARLAAIVVLAIASLGLVGTGALPWSATIARYFKDGFAYKGLEGLELVAGVLGTGLMALGLTFAGLALRISKWQASPAASLALSISSVVLLAGSLLLYLQSDLAVSQEGHKLLAAILLPSALLAVLPSLQHGLSGRRRTPRQDGPAQDC